MYQEIFDKVNLKASINIVFLGHEAKIFIRFRSYRFFVTICNGFGQLYRISNLLLSEGIFAVPLQVSKKYLSLINIQL